MKLDLIMPGIAAAVLLAVGLLPAAARAQDTAAQGGDMTFLVTYGTGNAWKAVDPPEDIDAIARLKAGVEKLLAENPDAILLDLGRFTGPESFFETAYDAPSVVFYTDKNYAAVNMTSYDYFRFAANTEGAKRRPIEFKELFLSSLDHPEDFYLPLYPSKKAETARGTIELMSLADASRLAGLPIVQERAVKQTPEEVIAPVVETREGPAILMSELPPARNDELVRAWPALDMVLETTPGPPQARRVGNTFLVPRGDETEIQKIVARRTADGQFSAVELSRTPWIDREDYDRLVNPPLPIIGMSVPGQGRVAERFGVRQEDVTVDVFRDSHYPGLTSREAIHVYHILQDGQPTRAMRVWHNFQRGWMHFDAIVQLNSDRTIRRLETNEIYFPIIYFPTRLGEAIEAIKNRPVEQWEIAPEILAGYEAEGEEVIRALRRAVELDKILYPDATAGQTANPAPGSGG